MDLFNRGHSGREIAQILGCSSATVSKYHPDAKITELGEKVIELRKDGLSIREIAKELDIGKSTASKWASKMDAHAKIKKENRNKLVKKSIEKRNKRRKKQEKKYDNYRNWRSKVRKARREWFIDLLGGECQCCSYNKSNHALNFHHVDPTIKRVKLSGNRLLNKMDTLLEELEKCVLLCANCHAEHHHGDPKDLEATFNKDDIDEIPEELNLITIELTDEIRDKEIKWINEKKVIRKIKSPKPRDIDVNNVRLDKIKKDEANDILSQYHYLGASNKGAIENFGFFIGEEIIGCAIVTNPVRQSSFKNVCEISRFVLVYRCDNLASKCLSLIIKFLKANHGFNYLQAYSEDGRHLGTIYKAANFRQLGSSKTSYNYEGIHKKTIYERAKAFGMSEHEYAEEFNLDRITEPGKTKFIYNLN